MSISIITQAADKIKSDFGKVRQTGVCREDFGQSSCDAKFKVGDIATDGSFSCRPIVAISSPLQGFVYHFEGVLFGCPEESIRRPSQTNQPLMPLSPPISAAKYKVGDVATVLIGSYLFACRRIVSVERYSFDSAFHYVFEGITGAFREGDVVLAEDTTPKMPHWDGVSCDLSSFRETKSDFATNDTVKSPSSVTTQNHDNQHYQPVDCHPSSDTYSLSLPDSTRLVLCLEYESNQSWQNPPQYLDDLTDEPLASSQSIPAPVPVEPSEELLVAHARKLILNYEHHRNSFGSQKSIDLCGALSLPKSDELIYWANLGARFTLLKNEHDAQLNL